MATGAQFVELNAKRLLGREDFRDRWFDFMRETTRENMEQTFRVAGVYDSALGIAADGANKIQITGANRATDGKGNLLDIASALVSSAIQFQNTAAITYDVALHKTVRPDGIRINPRSGLPEYSRNLEEIGERAEPDSVVDNGGTITFVVDSVTEAGVSNAGRQVMVFRKAPHKNATTAGEAIETRVVSWSGSVNRITTAGALGQGASISTTASDYEVILLGPTVSRNTDLASTGEHCFLGTVTGNGGTPTVFDTASQNVIDFSLSDIGDITKRDPGSGHIKIDVKSFATDVNPAITVRDDGGAPVFTVDKNGNLWVAGTTTQENVVQVNSSETITDNLTAGDDQDVDSHTIKGDWSHLVGASTKFYVDGSTGRVGIGGFDSVGYSLHVTGKTRVSDDIEPALDGGASLGSAGKRFSDLFVINLSFSGDFLPQIDDSQDLGSSVRRWAEGHFSQAIAIGDGNAPPLAAIHIDKNHGASSGIRWDRPDTPAISYAQTYESNGFMTWTKTEAQNAVYAWGNVGDIDSGSPLGRGFRWSGPTLLEAATPKTNHFNVFRRQSSTADPADIDWVFQMSGTSTTKTGLRFQTFNGGEYAFRVNANEQMRIANDWVGIGDTTPDANTERLSVYRSYGAATGAPAYGARVVVDIQTAEAQSKYGILGQANASIASGTLASVSGVYGHGRSVQSGTVTDVRGVVGHVSEIGATATITNAKAFEAFSPGGNIINAYGLYVNHVTAGATLNYAIWTGNGEVRFGDKVTIAANGLDVTGAGVFNTSLGVGGTGISVTAGGINVVTGGIDVDAGGINIDAGGLTIQNAGGDALLGDNLKVGNGLYVGDTAGTAYDNDVVIVGGLAVGFTGTDPNSDTVYMGDPDNWIGFNGGDPMWRVDENVPATNANLWFDRSAKSWNFVCNNASKLSIFPTYIAPYQPIAPSHNTTWFKSFGESNLGSQPTSDGIRMGGDNSNWHGYGNDSFLFEKTDGNSHAPDGAIVFSTSGFDGATTVQATTLALTGAHNAYLPNGTFYFNGTNTLIYNHVVQCTANFYLTYNGTDPILNWDTNDYMVFDRSANYLDWYINTVHEMRLTPNGLEVGNGISVGAYIAPTDNTITLGDSNYHLKYTGSSTGVEFMARGISGDMKLQATGLADDWWRFYSNNAWVLGIKHYPSAGAGNRAGMVSGTYSVDWSFKIHETDYIPNMATSGGSAFYGRDVGSTANMFVRNEANVISQLSPHDPVTGEWYFNTYSPRTGETKKIYMERLVEALEELLGESFTEYISGEQTNAPGNAKGRPLEDVKARGRGNMPTRIANAIAAKAQGGGGGPPA